MRAPPQTARTKTSILPVEISVLLSKSLRPPKMPCRFFSKPQGMIEWMRTSARPLSAFESDFSGHFHLSPRVSVRLICRFTHDQHGAALDKDNLISTSVSLALSIHYSQLLLSSSIRYIFFLQTVARFLRGIVQQVSSDLIFVS